MGFPSEKELKKVRAKLAKAEPSRVLPPNASQVERLKFKLCEKFVVYLLKTKTSQAQLARKLRIDPARINEIIKYRIDLFTIDKLLELVEKLDPDFRVKVA